MAYNGVYCYSDSALKTTAGLADFVFTQMPLTGGAATTVVTLPSNTAAASVSSGATIATTGTAPTTSSSMAAAAAGPAFTPIRFDIPVVVMLLMGLGIVLL